MFPKPLWEPNNFTYWWFFCGCFVFSFYYFLSLVFLNWKDLNSSLPPFHWPYFHSLKRHNPILKQLASIFLDGFERTVNRFNELLNLCVCLCAHMCADSRTKGFSHILSNFSTTDLIPITLFSPLHLETRSPLSFPGCTWTHSVDQHPWTWHLP